MFEQQPPLARWQDKQHWRDARGRSFRNPWASYRPEAGTKWDIFRALLWHPKKVPVPDDIADIYRVVKPEWSRFEDGRARVTWIGHATFVVELPKPPSTPVEGDISTRGESSRGIRILFDPVFSKYTSPSWAARLGLGPKRYSALPCSVDDLPEIDVVCISHNHYDHLDLLTVQALEARTNGTMQYICGLNNRRHFTRFGVAPERVYEMDWGDVVRVTVPELGMRHHFDMTCCPAQHTSARTITDTDHSLWCSWLISTPSAPSLAPAPMPPRASTTSAALTTPASSGGETKAATTTNSNRDAAAVGEQQEEGRSQGKKIYFLGDTGYRYTPTEDRAGWPTCPIFAEIGEAFDGIDLAMIPIGLYAPRNLLSNVHLCPEDSAEVHVALRSRKSIGMHFGTFRGGLSRNFEQVLEPPLRLAKALEQLKVPRDEFVTIDIGGHVDV